MRAGPYLLVADQPDIKEIWSLRRGLVSQKLLCLSCSWAAASLQQIIQDPVYYPDECMHAHTEHTLYTFIYQGMYTCMYHIATTHNICTQNTHAPMLNAHVHPSVSVHQLGFCPMQQDSPSKHLSFTALNSVFFLIQLCNC